MLTPTLPRPVPPASRTSLSLLPCSSLLGAQLLGYQEWTGRSLSLLDPTYAKKYIPIISSVSEHQPTTWTSFFFDLHICVRAMR